MGLSVLQSQMVRGDTLEFVVCRTPIHCGRPIDCRDLLRQPLGCDKEVSMMFASSV
jgi:hypothetical protein